MPSISIGYGRVSTVDQQAGLDAQLRDLKAAGCEEILAEQVSTVAKRDKEALRFARRGDILVVCKPDRLGRSITDLLSIVEDLDRRGAVDRRLAARPSSRLGHGEGDRGRLVENLGASALSSLRGAAWRRARPECQPLTRHETGAGVMRKVHFSDLATAPNQPCSPSSLDSQSKFEQWLLS
jgi:hypothetical protein